MSWLPKGFEVLSGLPEHRRKRRLVVALQAWYDDSGTKGTGRALALGGLIAEAQALADAVTDWEKECRADYPGRIRYFKSDEARNLRGEFQDWSEESRDLKIQRLQAQIDRADLMVHGIIVNLRAHQQMEMLVSTFNPILDVKKHGMNHPYMLAFHILILTTAAEVKRRGVTERIEIFFDRQEALKKHLREYYDQFLESMRDEELKALLPEQIFFRDDLDFPALQCADLLAGDMRRRAERDKKLKTLNFRQLTISPMSMVLGTDILRTMTEDWIGQPVIVMREAPEK